MRLWAEQLIPHLPRQHLLGQHSEICGMRGLGWGRKHSTVDYVFQYAPILLVRYHLKVIAEMINRGYKVSDEWLDVFYRGKKCEPWDSCSIRHCAVYTEPIFGDERVTYPEHGEAYLQECLSNLAGKGVVINL